jgi:hypothetical protein
VTRVTTFLQSSVRVVDFLCSQFGCPSDEVGREAGDVGVGEAVGVVVLGVLLACGGEVGRELFGGDGGSQVVAQGGEQARGCPCGLAE